jgi:hypothetical protein
MNAPFGVDYTKRVSEVKRITKDRVVGNSLAAINVNSLSQRSRLDHAGSQE